MKVLARFTSDDRKFLKRRQATVRRRDRFAGGLAVPDREEFQAWGGNSPAAPRHVNAPDIDVPSSECSRTGNTVEEMLEAAHVARSGVVLPAMNVNEEERSLRLVDHFESRFSLI